MGEFGQQQRLTLGIGGVVVTKYDLWVLVEADADWRLPPPNAAFSLAESVAASPSAST